MSHLAVLNLIVYILTGLGKINVSSRVDTRPSIVKESVQVPTILSLDGRKVILKMELISYFGNSMPQRHQKKKIVNLIRFSAHQCMKVRWALASATMCSRVYVLQFNLDKKKKHLHTYGNMLEVVSQEEKLKAIHLQNQVQNIHSIQSILRSEKSWRVLN